MLCTWTNLHIYNLTMLYLHILYTTYALFSLLTHLILIFFEWKSVICNNDHNNSTLSKLSLVLCSSIQFSTHFKINGLHPFTYFRCGFIFLLLVSACFHSSLAHYINKHFNCFVFYLFPWNLKWNCIWIDCQFSVGFLLFCFVCLLLSL